MWLEILSHILRGGGCAFQHELQVRRRCDCRRTNRIARRRPGICQHSTALVRATWPILPCGHWRPSLSTLHTLVRVPTAHFSKTVRLHDPCGRLSAASSAGRKNSSHPRRVKLLHPMKNRFPLHPPSTPHLTRSDLPPPTPRPHASNSLPPPRMSKQHP